MKKPTLLIVFLTVFIDVVGFSIIFPLFPAMLDYYLKLDGKESLIGSLVAWLDQFAGGDTNAVATLFGGVVGSLYGFLQFVFAPIWGAYSDRHGRRPTLIFTLGGIVLANLIWVFAGSFALLVLGRALGGIMAGNISTASAVAADITTGKNRASGMIIIGVALGLGFILGPAIGGFAFSWQLVEPGKAVAGLALHPFSGPAIIALAIAGVNWLLVIFLLSESLPPEKREQQLAKRGFNPFAQLKRINLPGVARTNLMYFAYWCAFSSVEFTITFFATEKLGFKPVDIAWMFVFIGMSLIFFQGGVARQLIKRVGERRTALAGVCCTLPGFLIIGNAASTERALRRTAPHDRRQRDDHAVAQLARVALHAGRPAGPVARRVPFAWLAEPSPRPDHGRLALLEIRQLDAFLGRRSVPRRAVLHGARPPAGAGL